MTSKPCSFNQTAMHDVSKPPEYARSTFLPISPEPISFFKSSKVTDISANFRSENTTLLANHRRPGSCSHSIAF